jgi:hypothetical protein
MLDASRVLPRATDRVGDAVIALPALRAGMGGQGQFYI